MDITKIVFDWLNRLGLFLGLASTILLSPQLIGLDRLKYWEKRLVLRLRLIEGFSFYHQSRFLIFFGHNKYLIRASVTILAAQIFTITVILSDPATRQDKFQYLLNILPIATLLLSLYVGVQMAKEYPSGNKLWDYLKWIAFSAFCFAFAIPITILILLIMLSVVLTISMLSSLQRLVGSLIQRLEGDWLLGLMTGTGIFTLFVSFFLQLIATFR